MLPVSLDKWDLNSLNDIIKFTVTENEKLDFKDSRIINNSKELDKVFCAMANSSGGFIVLGLEEIRDVNKNLIGYKKQGFTIGKEDGIHHIISQRASLIDPYPTFRFKDIKENDIFFTVVEIIPDENHKPYFTQDGRCYIRIGESSMPANRSIILSMYLSHTIPWELKLKHYDYILEIFEKLAFSVAFIKNSKYVIEVPYDTHDYALSRNFLTPEKEKESLNDSTEDIDNLVHYDWAMTHLKSYTNEYILWEKLTNKIETFNQKVDTYVVEVITYLRSKFTEFLPSFRIIDKPKLGDHQSSESFIDLNSVIQFLLYNILIHHDDFNIDNITIKSFTKPSSPFDVDNNSNEYNTNQLRILNFRFGDSQSSDLIINFKENEIDIQKLKASIKEIIVYLKNMLSPCFTLDKDIFSTGLTFKREMNNLIRDLRSGEILKGTCKIGF